MIFTLLISGSGHDRSNEKVYGYTIEIILEYGVNYLQEVTVDTPLIRHVDKLLELKILKISWIIH